MIVAEFAEAAAEEVAPQFAVKDSVVEVFPVEVEVQVPAEGVAVADVAQQVEEIVAAAAVVAAPVVVAVKIAVSAAKEATAAVVESESAQEQ